MYISSEVFFEAVHTSTQDVVAMGGEINAENIINAFKNGVFPWYNEGEEILWWCPLERFVLFPKNIKESHTMKQVFVKSNWKFTENKDFLAVITACQTINRSGQKGTWINNEIINSFLELHKLGWAKSYEVWENNELIGGFYGMDLGTVFCGESMFSYKSNASKAAFIRFAKNSKHQLIDCQVYTEHLESLGAEIISKNEFLNYLPKSS